MKGKTTTTVRTPSAHKRGKSTDSNKRDTKKPTDRKKSNDTRSKSKDSRKGGDKKRELKQGERKKGAPKWKNVEAEVELIKKRIGEEIPPSGVLYYKYKASAGGENNQELANEEKAAGAGNIIANRKIIETDDKSKIKIRFSDMPISKATTSGLFKAKFVKMTEVQRSAIPHAIAGRDLVVCSRTGSGKTLCYLISIIERLY